MKKRPITILALSAALALGSCLMSSQAAEQGWAMSGSSWVYYGDNGYKVTNEWRRGADNLWRYLDGSGQMSINTWVENTYYVDANGILVADKWLKIKDSDGLDKWYYFGNSGKVTADTWKKLDNKFYLFDSDGAMVTGWSDDYNYYLGDDGVMRTGWIYLKPPSDYDNYNYDHFTPEMEGEDGKFWYYFTSNGKKYTPNLSNGSDYKQYKIEDSYYCFNEQGQMQTGWQNMTGDESTGIRDYKFFGEDGKARTGWFSTTPPENLSSNYDDEVQWYYFNSNGSPKVGPAEGSASTSDFFRINNNTYLFNEYGNPVYGLQRISIGSSGDDTAYYFGTKSVSSVVKGKVKLDQGGDKIDFYFSDSGSYSGRGYTGVKDNYLYYKGRLQKADSGSKYLLVRIPSGSSEVTYAVNSSGRVAKSTTVKDGDGNKIKVNSKGVVVEINGTEVKAGEAGGTEPVEPDWEY